MDLYVCPGSPPCISVLLTARALGVEANKISIDVHTGEHLKEDFLAINPQHCLPTLVDGDLTLSESRAICQYLVNQYGSDDVLYPKDAPTRAKVDYFLNFDLGTLYRRCIAYIEPIVMGSPPDEDALNKVHEAMGWLNDFLEEKDYLLGNDITIADYSVLGTVVSAKECGIDMDNYEHITAWLERCMENIDGYSEDCAEVASAFGEYFKSKLAEVE